MHESNKPKMFNVKSKITSSQNGTAVRFGQAQIRQLKALIHIVAKFFVALIELIVVVQGSFGPFEIVLGTNFLNPFKIGIHSLNATKRFISTPLKFD